MAKSVNKERRLAYLLRHDASYNFDSHGWREVKDLVENHGFTLVELDSIVKNNNKQRFEFSEDRLFIRARQGHSLDVDVQLEKAEPPQYLYHGTIATNIKSIKEKGLCRMSRQHVHLSIDKPTALQVGRRRKGEVVILRVLAKKMWDEGHPFWLSRNNIWLTEAVPPQYIDK